MIEFRPARIGTLVALVGLGVAAQAQSQTPSQLSEGPRFYVGLTAGVAAAIADDYDTDRNETGSGRPSAGIFAGLRMFDLPVGTLMALVGLGGAAQAQSQTPSQTPSQLSEGPRFYVGLTAGVAAAIADDYDTDRNETGSGRPSAGIFAGLRMFDLPVGKGWPVAVELGYQDISSHTMPYRVGGGTTDLTARGHSSYLALKVSAPLGERVALYGRLGAARNVVDGNTPAGQTPIDIDGRRTGLLAGFGAEFQLMPNLTLRAEATSFGRASANARAGGLGAGIAVAF